jgi:hypothetical protein
MSTSRRLLLLVLLFALPLQGAVAAARLCLATLAAPGSAVQAVAGHAHAAGPEDVAHHAGAHTPVDAQKHAQHAHDGTPGDEQASDTCSLCAACCLTVAVAPQAPGVVVLPAAYAGHAPVRVPVLHNVADGLERPPRTT